MGYYKYKLIYGYKGTDLKFTQYFGKKSFMEDYISARIEKDLIVFEQREIKVIDNEISELVTNDILKSTSKTTKCEIGSIKITATKNNREIIISALNQDSQKFVDLFNKSFKKFRVLLAVAGVITPGEDGELILSLEKQTYDTNDTSSKSNNVYGYCRVSTKGQLDNNSLEQQQAEIQARYINAKCYEESYTGKTMDRPVFNALLDKLSQGDTLVVSKLDRLCRSTREGLEVIQTLKDKGVRIHILNMGLIEDTPMGNLIVTNLLAFAEFERAMIVERTQAGKAIAKTKEDFREGRPKKFTKKQIDHAISLLSINGGDKSYKEVEEITSISKSTLIRAMRLKKQEK